ncbi:hypothetical protein K0M31_010827 [Melipona bicolor]|uniref:Uncharacterized protein n=1 Tax=Melipona bicolor TaxID=60889 RepID=A0AA40FLD2_9HYME|nr:hypothetical protein K0M31_010827 [Melipona bicolor]
MQKRLVRKTLEAEHSLPRLPDIRRPERGGAEFRGLRYGTRHFRKPRRPTTSSFTARWLAAWAYRKFSTAISQGTL